MIVLMNATGFNLSAVGNHEFDTGIKGLGKLISQAKFLFLCASLTNPTDKGLQIEPYKIVTMPNGVDIAFISVININSSGIPDRHPDDVKGLTFEKTLKAIQKYLHLADSVNMVLCLTHGVRS